MTEPKDQDHLLLEQYARDASESSFSELVRRHVDLVWNAAWRVTGDPDLARDIAQTVFTDLARKARFIPSAASIPGWLYRASVLSARKALRTNQRRTAREKEAMQLSQLSDSDSAAAERLLPLLDEGLQSLNSRDREIVVLRFFSRKSLAEIGAAHAISEDAAQKRVSRALEKLKSFFAASGQAVPSGIILAALTSAGSAAAPASVATTLIGASYLSLAAGAGWGSSVTSFLAGTGQQILIMKTKIAIASLATVAVTVPLLIQHRTIAALEQKRPLSFPTAVASLADTVSQDQLAADWARHLRDRAELDQLRAEAASLTNATPAEPALLRRLAVAREKFDAAKASAKLANDAIEATKVRIHTINVMKRLGLAARIFASENKERFPKTFEEFTNVIGEIGIPLETFEFVEHEREISEREPELILFREKDPRKQPDGTWQRTYTRADGSVHTITNDIPDFSVWEKQFIAREQQTQ